MTDFLHKVFPREYGKLPYVYLVYWFLYLYYIMIYANSLQETLLGVSLLLLFLVPYRWSWWRKENSLILALSLEVLIIVLMVFLLGPTFIYMCFYVAGPMAALKKTKKIVIGSVTMQVILTVALKCTLQPINGFGSIMDLLPLYVTATMMPFGVRVYNRWRQTSVELLEANEQIERLTQQAERERIARDLHDILGHTLSMITLKSELSEKLVLRDPERAMKEINEVQHASRSALQQVRDVVSNMHTISLLDEIDNASRILAAADINYLVRGVGEEVRVSAVAGTILAMCLREAVTNVVRHSKAHFCVIELKQTQTGTEICVIDNGTGIAHQGEGQEKTGGHGLYGMRQRLELVGGTLQMLSGEPQGTTVVMSIPRIVSGRGEERVG